MCVSYHVCVIYEIPASIHSDHDAEKTDPRPRDMWSVVDQIEFRCRLTPLAEDGMSGCCSHPNPPLFHQWCWSGFAGGGHS